MELPSEISDKIDELAEQGNQFIEDGQFDRALETWMRGLELIPAPQNAYSESVWFLVSIGDIYFLKDEFKKAWGYFQDAMRNLSGEGITNPFVLMRAGQCCFELGDEKNAKEFLLKAYMLEGEEIFEEDDEKYFLYLKNNVDLEE